MVCHKNMTGTISGDSGSFECLQMYEREEATSTSKMETVNAGNMMSLAALQRQDPYINKLLDVTGQVALYNFNSKANEWVSAREPKIKGLHGAS